MIQVNGLTRRYGDIAAVSDLSFSVAEGEIIGFLGPNGAGKTTTMNMITGCLRATAGTVTVDGADIETDADRARKIIGYLPENPPLYPDMTVDEYLEFVYRLKKCQLPQKEHLDSVCDMAGLSDVRGRLIRNLSKGYRQRVGIAQALLGNPRYIILDEPTVGLDPLQIIEIRDLIRELGEKHTVILSSHILSEVQAICESVLIIAHGKLVAFDTPQNLERMLAANNRLVLTAETDEAGMRAILDGQTVVSSYTIEQSDLPQYTAAPVKPAPAPEAEETEAPEPQPEEAAPEEIVSAPVEAAEAVLPADPAAAPAEPAAPAAPTCKATVTLGGDPVAACRTLFFAFADANCALLQMTPIKADLENIFIELTEDEPSGKEATDHESGV